MKNEHSIFSYTVVMFVTFFVVFNGCYFGYLFDIPIIKIISGILLTSFIPGFVLLKILFPQPNDLSNIEKVILAISVSLLISMIASLIINLFPSGLNYWTILLSLGGLTFVLLIISGVQDRRIIKNVVQIPHFDKSLVLLSIPVISLSIAFLVLSIFKNDKKVDYIEFSLETVEYGLANQIGNEQFMTELLVQNNYENDGMYVVNCYTEGNIVATTDSFVVKSGESKKISINIVVEQPGDRLEFVLVNADTNAFITRLWYQLK